MPIATENELNRVRDRRPHELEWFLAVAPFGDPIWTGAINDNTIVRGTMVVLFDGGVGNLAGVLPGMTLWVGQTGSVSGLADLGTVRIRGVTGSYIYVAENDDILWADNNPLIVPGEAGFRELWGVFPRLVEGDPVTFFKDYDIAYTNEGDRIPPKANAGPAVIDTIYAASGTSVTLFIGEDSWAPEIGGSPIASWSWNFADGTPATSILEGTRVAPIEVGFPSSGFRYVELTVADTLGTTGTTYIPVWISPDDTYSNLYWRVEVQELGGTLEGGWRARLKVHEANETDFPDQALVVLGCKSWWGGVEDDIGGYPHRENIRFVGWLDRETLTFDATVGSVEFEAICSAQVMNNLPGFTVSLDEDATPSNWTEMSQPNVDKLMQHLLQFHSTVNQVCHVEPAGEGASRQVPCPQVFQKNSILSQVNDDLLIDAQCRLTANRQGLLVASRNPQMIDRGAGRDAIAVVCTLVDRDFQDEVVEAKPHRAVLGHMEGGGFDANETPFLSQAPGDCPLQQIRESRLGELILADQTELNLWSGLYLAQANNPYPRVPVDLVGNWPIFDVARQEYVRVTVVDPLGRNPLSDQRFIVRGIRFEEQGASKTTTTALELEMESWGPPGETVPVPDPPPPDDPYNPPGPTPPPNYGGRLHRVILRTTAGVYCTEEFHQDHPDINWYASNSSLDADGRQNMRWISFDFNHGERLFMINDHWDGGAGSAGAAAGAYRNSDIFGGSAWSLQFDHLWPATQINGAGDGRCNPVPVGDCTDDMDGMWWALNCDPSDGHLDFIAGFEFPCVVAGWAGDGCRRHKRAFYSDDGLDTCTRGDGLWHDPFANCGPDHCSTPLAGQITRSSSYGLYTYVCAWGAGGDCHRGYSANGGATVTTSAGQVAAWTAVNIWHTRVREVVVFYRGGGLDLGFSSNHGINFTVEANALPINPMDAGQSLTLHHLQSLRGLYVDVNNDIYRTTDGGHNWLGITGSYLTPYCVTDAFDSEVASDGLMFIIGCDDPTDSLYVWMTTDHGDSWINKTGNLGTVLGAGETILQIVPVNEVAS